MYSHRTSFSDERLTPTSDLVMYAEGGVVRRRVNCTTCSKTCHKLMDLTFYQIVQQEQHMTQNRFWQRIASFFDEGVYCRILRKH